LCILFALLVDVLIYRAFGNTPGKAWLGLQVKTVNGSPLEFTQYLTRNGKFYVSGLALGLPIIGLITIAYQSIRLRKGLQASYDESTGSRVYEKPVSWIRKISFGGAFICLFFVMLVLKVKEDNNHDLATSSINQKISNNLTLNTDSPDKSTQDISNRAYELYKEGRYTEAFPIYEDLAKKDGVIDQYNLGYMFQHGEGITKDSRQAAYWFEKSATQGYVIAQNSLAQMYSGGDGIVQSYTQAAIWYEKAAMHGSSSAQVSLSWYYMNGLGTNLDYKKAAYWNEQGANNGDPEGFNNLGYLYEHGLGVAKDLNKAAELYQNAINKGIERGVEKERIDEAKSRLANLKAFNNSSDNQIEITESNDTFRVKPKDGMKFEIKGNLLR
jgi:hypothetical protein